MSIQNRNNVVSSEYLRRGMRTPENRTYFKNSARSNGIKLSFDQSKSKLNRFEISKKYKNRGSSAYSSSEGRKYYKNSRNFVNENKKNP